MSAVSAGHLGVAEFLLARAGAAPSVNALSKDGRVPLHYHKGNAKIAALLLPRTARRDGFAADSTLFLDD